jgi:hypothetical protein
VRKLTLVLTKLLSLESMFEHRNRYGVQVTLAVRSFTSAVEVRTLIDQFKWFFEQIKIIRAFVIVVT